MGAVKRANTWRWLRGGVADGAWHMAADEALLECCARRGPEATAVWRTYGWARPTLSLGRHQDVSKVKLDALLEEGVDLVRRPTGGAAVVHGTDFTCAVIARLDQPPFAGGVSAAYRLLASVWMEALRGLGVEGAELARGEPGRTERVSCFGSAGAWEVVRGPSKLVGSAQLRRARAMLYQATVPLEDPHPPYARLLELEGPEPIVGLRRVLGCPVGAEELERALAAALASRIGVALEESPLSPNEAVGATRLRAWKYLDSRWTYEGRLAGLPLARVLPELDRGGPPVPAHPGLGEDLPLGESLQQPPR